MLEKRVDEIEIEQILCMLEDQVEKIEDGEEKKEAISEIQAHLKKWKE